MNIFLFHLDYTLVKFQLQTLYIYISYNSQLLKLR